MRGSRPTRSPSVEYDIAALVTVRRGDVATLPPRARPNLAFLHRIAARPLRAARCRRVKWDIAPSVTVRWRDVSYAANDANPPEPFCRPRAYEISEGRENVVR